MARSPLPFRVIPCDEWKAREPSGAIARAGRPSETIFHHTAGHVPNVSKGETYAEACAYARGIQGYHMGQGWVDSGHNFLVTRGGYILEGRHGSLASLKAGVMVVSAHCPEHNSSPGVEHEHLGDEKLTPIQREATVWLHARICRWTAMKPKQIMKPHKQFFPTACPGSLAAAIPGLRKAVEAELKPAPKKPSKADEAWYAKFGPKEKPDWFFPLLREAQKRYGD